MQQVLWQIPVPWTNFRIPIYGFGMMLFLTFILCTWLAGWRARRVGIAPQHIQDLVIWLFFGGLLGARICHLLFEQEWRGWGWFFTQLPQIWNGGIVFYGSVFGGLAGYLGAWWFIFRKDRTPTLRLADVIAPSLALGLCLGRIGCLLNGCCYGQVACADCAVYPRVHFPLSAPAREGLVREGIQTAAGFTLAREQPPDGARVEQVVPNSPAWNSGLRPGDLIVGADGKKNRELAHYLEEMDQEEHVSWEGKSFAELLSVYAGRLRYWPRGKSDLTLTVLHDGKETNLTFQPRTVGLYPTQLYESVSMFLLLLVLLAYEPFRCREGQVMALVMMGYGIHRFLNEILRDDPRPEGFESYTSIVLVAAGLALWLWLQLKPAARKVEVEKAQPAAAGA
jgi:phosphatidylglycerol:prolipoprotein diacylglycerol transferase